MFKKIKAKIRSIILNVKEKIQSIIVHTLQARAVVANNKAEGYVDFGLRVLIAVVLGGLLLAGLYSLFNGNILPTLGKKITDLFNYSGS
jgi:uncharacterized membrane protein